MSKLVNPMPTFTSEDGTLIQASTQSGAGWKGVALNPNTEDYPFSVNLSIAWIKEAGLEHLLESFNLNSFMPSFGWFSCEQEARYVAGLCLDPDMMEFMMENYQAMNQHRDTPSGTAFTDFPSYIYDEAVNLTPAEAYARTKQSATEKSTKGGKKNLTKQEKAVKAVNDINVRATKANKAAADLRAAYVANMPEWLREMSS